MKRYFAVLLILITLFTLGACKADNAAKFCGTWTDETGSTVLILNNDNTAVLRNDDYLFIDAAIITWTADDYDHISLWYTFPDSTENTQSTETTIEGTEGTEVTEATAESPDSTKPAEKQLLGKFLLTIRGGVMYLSSDKDTKNTIDLNLVKQK